MEFYPDDSLWTLTPAGQAGLALLSLVLAAAVTVLALRILRKIGSGRKRLVWRCLAALGLFWGFLWLSPQIYYAYYQAIIPGLPRQFVIGWPPGPARLWELMSFTPARPSIAEHARGLLGWVLLLTAFSSPR